MISNILYINSGCWTCYLSQIFESECVRCVTTFNIFHGEHFVRLDVQLVCILKCAIVGESDN
jgi:hypothetical protein